MYNCRLCGAGVEQVFNADNVPSMVSPKATSITVYRCNTCGLYQTDAVDDTPHGKPVDGFYHNIIEHKANIDSFIKGLPDGVLTLTCPNLDFILKEKCWQEFTPLHISYFSVATLTAAFTRNMFMVLGCYPINNGQDIEIRVKRPKIAMWGAGHRALTWMAGNRDVKPQYVVDSNPEKQGTKTAITGYPIVAPKTLLTKKVDVLIVSVPGKYPEQVLEQIRAMRLDCQVAKIC